MIFPTFFFFWSQTRLDEGRKTKESLGAGTQVAKEVSGTPRLPPSLPIAANAVKTNPGTVSRVASGLDLFPGAPRSRTRAQQSEKLFWDGRWDGIGIAEGLA